MSVAVPDIEVIQALFHQALDLPENVDRAGWLRSRCEGDNELYAEVDSLLVAHQLRKLGMLQQQSPKPPPPELEPARPLPRFGPFQTTAIIGSGGMGTVFRARRDDGQYVQDVAVKVLRASLRSEWIRQKFLTERQLLARLNHPGIAKLMDGGMTAEHEPYIVMELVEGSPLNAYCDSRRLPIEDRLRLFAEVADAVDYAHRNMILHRDLKPSNILVSSDGETPKLLDFGTATLLSTEDGQDPSAVTVTRARMLTPRYASPEQLRGDRPGIPGDIFSLGVILYELLTGAWPFGNPDSPLNELKRAVGDMAPTAPTATVTEEAAEARGAQPRERLRRRLRGDLSAIVLKALDNDPDRRYQTAAGLALDIRRHLEGKPVEARRQTAWYRSWKFVRRNRMNVALAVLIAGGLVAWAVYSQWQARVERRRAEIVGRLVQKLTSEGLTEQNLEEAAAIPPGEMTNEARRILVEAQLSFSRKSWSPFDPSASDPAQAISHYREALKTLEGLARAAPPSNRDLQNRADIAMEMSDIMIEVGQGGNALDMPIAPMVASLHGNDSAEGIGELAAQYDMLSDRLGKKTVWSRLPQIDSSPAALKRIAKAKLSLATDRAAMALYRVTLAKSGQGSKINPMVGLQLGRLMGESGNRGEGRSVLSAALVEFSRDGLGGSRAAASRAQLGRIEEADGNMARALEHFEAARTFYEDAFAKSKDPFYIDRIAGARLNSARVMTRLGRKSQALSLARSAADLLRRLIADPITSAQRLDLAAYNLMTLEPVEARDRAAALAAAETAVNRTARQMPAYLTTLSAAQFMSDRMKESEATAGEALLGYRRAMASLKPLFDDASLAVARQAYDASIRALDQ